MGAGSFATKASFMAGFLCVGSTGKKHPNILAFYVPHDADMILHQLFGRQRKTQNKSQDGSELEIQSFNTS